MTQIGIGIDFHFDMEFSDGFLGIALAAFEFVGELEVDVGEEGTLSECGDVGGDLAVGGRGGDEVEGDFKFGGLFGFDGESILLAFGFFDIGKLWTREFAALEIKFAEVDAFGLKFGEFLKECACGGRVP